MNLWRSQPTAYYSSRSRFARRLCMTLVHGRWVNATGLLYAFFSLFGYVTFCYISRIGEPLVSRWDALRFSWRLPSRRSARRIHGTTAICQRKLTDTRKRRRGRSAISSILFRLRCFASRKSRIGGIYCYTLPIYRVILGGVSMREVNTGQTISCYALANIDGWLRDALGNNGNINNILIASFLSSNRIEIRIIIRRKERWN